MESGSGVWTARSGYLDRWIQIGVASGKVIKVDVDTDPTDGGEDGDHPVLDRLLAVVDEGEPDDLRDVPIGLTVDTGYRAIYRTCRELSYGETASVAELVTRTPGVGEDEDGASLVRSALAANPVPIIVPTHRVDDATGSLQPDVVEALRTRERR